MSAGDGLISVSVESIPEQSPAKWAEGRQFRLPRAIFEGSAFVDAVDGEGRLKLSAESRVVDRSQAECLRTYRAFTEQPPVSSRLPISYHKVPAWARNLIASAIGSAKRRSVDKWAAFPAWPLDLSSDFIADLASMAPSPFAGGPTPVLLTHDLDSLEGLVNLATLFLDAEENAGARSTNYIVPCAWPIDYGLLDEVRARGNEIGVHGYDHSNLTPYLASDARAERLRAARGLIERYGVIGYRAPSLVRTRALLKDLGGYYRYDSSIPTSGGLFPVPNNGCASARPFRIEGIVEIPVTMPRDGSLRFLGYRPDEILDVWIKSADEISCSGGVVVLLVHCERRFSGNSSMLQIYRRFLDHLGASGRFVWSTPRQLLERFVASEKMAGTESSS